MQVKRDLFEWKETCISRERCAKEAYREKKELLWGPKRPTVEFKRDWGEDTATHCNMLQHAATRCYTLQHTATYCNTLQHTATHCTTLHQTATHCSTLHHIAKYCKIQEHAATQKVHCNTESREIVLGDWVYDVWKNMCGRVLKCVVVCGNWVYDMKFDGDWVCDIRRYLLVTECLTSRCNTLQYTATHCNILQHTATHCNILQHAEIVCNTVCRDTFVGIWVSEIAAHHIATHCNTLQHTATRCNTLQHNLQRHICWDLSVGDCGTATHCNWLQHTSTHCNTLHHTREHCNTLQLNMYRHICWYLSVRDRGTHTHPLFTTPVTTKKKKCVCVCKCVFACVWVKVYLFMCGYVCVCEYVCARMHVWACALTPNFFLPRLSQPKKKYKCSDSPYTEKGFCTETQGRVYIYA